MKMLLTVAIMQIAIIKAVATPIDQLLERIDKGASQKFKIELRQEKTTKNVDAVQKDFFELDQQGQRVVVRGNSWVNIAVGINWYLKYYAGIHLTWNHMNAQLPKVLPRVEKKERHDTPLTLRYAYNYCTFSYSMAFWDWERWQQEIDWLALHGVNMPLAIVGEECVWREMLLKLGYSEEQIGKFIAGPAFLAWWEMNNLEGWGGPLPRSWYDRQARLQRQILKRMKELGMHPVLPGYCGMMPSDYTNDKKILWNGFTRPSNVPTTDPRFDEISKLYYDELTRLYGKADFYSMDPFHESSDDASIDYAEAGRKLMAAMKRTNPQATWVIQGWTENPRPEMIDALKPGDLLILDLFSECRPMYGAPSIWRRKDGYKQHQWLFCLLQNFGANVGLHGRMDQLLDNFYSVDQPTMKGIGFTMEGTENNPVMFELMSELPWRPQKFEKEQWVKGYVHARYGLPTTTDEKGKNADNTSHFSARACSLSSERTLSSQLERSWLLLARTIYNCPAGNNQQGPHESIFCGRPSLNNFQASSWSKMKNYYSPTSTLEAARLFLKGITPLLSDAENGGHSSSTARDIRIYDLVDITRQALADQARVQYQHTIADYKAFDIDAFRRDSQRFLDMLLLQDELLGTCREFRLGHWLEAAKRCGTTTDEQQLYEWNARVQITTWGNRYCADTGGLRDYAHKEWQGLLKDFYYPRWKTYFDALLAQMEAQLHPQPELLGGGPNANKTAAELFAMALPQEVVIDWYAMEEPWTKAHNIYSAEPEGNALQVAQKIMNFLNGK